MTTKKPDHIENMILDRVAAISPWLTSLIPVYFIVYNVLEHLTKGNNIWDVAIVIVIGLVIETIGLAGVHTLIQFLNWNKTRNKTDPEAPMFLISLAVVVYVLIVISVNALLDLFSIYNPEAMPYVKIVVTALLSLLSLVSMLIVTLRAAQNDRVSKKQEKKLERSAAKDAGNLPEVSVKDAGKLPKVSQQVVKKDWRLTTHEERLEISKMTKKQLAVAYGLTQRTAENWLVSAQKYAQSVDAE